jgi:hypothetical protein
MEGMNEGEEAAKQSKRWKIIISSTRLQNHEKQAKERSVLRNTQ